MEKAKVYYTNLRVEHNDNLLKKLQRLCRKAKIADIDFNKKFVAVKIHFGEPGNLSYLRPNYAKAVCDLVKDLGGKPFLTDCNTLYVGRRKEALEHLDSAYENGFSPFSTGVHVIIADGLKGTDEALVKLEGCDYVKEAKIGQAIMDADIFISLSHFKGHESTGFGGCLKNIGMGSGSRAGKMEMHNSGKPDVDQDRCVGCKACSKNCAHNAIEYLLNNKAFINHDKCVGCGRCIGSCNFDAISNKQYSANKILDRKIAEYTKAVIQDRPSFHINLVIDVSPHCDCHSKNDMAIIPDVGMFASFDPVALDQACVDACNRQEVIKGSVLDDNMHSEDFLDHHDHFLNAQPESEWEECLIHAEKIGIGLREYELIEVK